MKENLGFFRVVLGVLGLIEALWTLPAIHSLYGANGLLQADLMYFVSGWSIPNTGATLKSVISNYDWVVTVITAVHLFFLVPFTMGVFYRTSSIVLWLTNTYYMNSGEMSVYGVNRYLHLFFFLAMILPLADSFRLGKKTDTRRDEKEYRWALWILRCAFAITYVHAGVSKSFGADWWSGDAVWRAVNLPEFKQYDLLWTSGWDSFYKILCWGTLFFETFYLFAIFIRPIQKPWLLIIISMHLGISLFMGLHFFAFAMICFNLALFFFEELRSLAIKAKFYQPENNPAQCSLHL